LVALVGLVGFELIVTTGAVVSIVQP